MLRQLVSVKSKFTQYQNKLIQYQDILRKIVMHSEYFYFVGKPNEPKVLPCASNVSNVSP
jgi:hypothetical protein